MRNRQLNRGQILPLFAILLVGICGMLALSIDVSSAYSARQSYRTAADAAALAGGQNLQVVGQRTVSSAEYTKARTDALKSLVDQFAATSNGACDPTANPITACDLPGTPFHVSIKTPLAANECVSCDPERSIGVAVNNPSFVLSFARVLGINSWNVGVGSVAGLSFKKSYAVITLRPPKKLGSTFDVNDIGLAGGSTVTVKTGDVGSNSNMNYTNTGGPTPSKMILDSGYRFYFYPAPAPDNDPGWVPPLPADPIGVPHTQPITDPNYTYPAMAGSLGTAPTFDDARTASCGAVGANPACTRADLDPACLTIASTKVPNTYPFMTSQLTSPDKIFCYKPGIYDTTNPKQLAVGPAELAILTPGVPGVSGGAYYFKSGLAVSGRLVGGYEAASPGVALMFDECNNQCIFNGNNALTISLNAGTRFPTGSGTPATAAIDWNGQPVQTSGPSGPTPAILMTLLVKKDTNGTGGTQGCTVPTSGPFLEPAACDANKNTTINLAGGGSLFIQGIQYMPTDNVNINGGSTGTGLVGQIIAWTLTYTGGTAINQEGATAQGPGLLRLDGACTASGTQCPP
jgi:hypothetical protein